MKRLTSLFAAAFLLANVFVFSANAATKKVPEFSMTSAKQINGTISEISTSGNYILIGKGKTAKKIYAGGAVIVKVTEGGSRAATLGELVKNQKVHVWASKKARSDKSYLGYVITQFLGAKALASQPPSAQFVAAASEGTETGLASPAVLLSKPAVEDAKIAYTISGTATGGGTDFTLANGELIIKKGQTAGFIPLVIANDSLVEQNETVIITLASATGATLGAQRIHTYTIKDDDAVVSPATQVGFFDSSVGGPENSSSPVFRIALGAAATQEVKVDYTLSGTATGGGTDYTLVNGTFTIPVGQTTASVTATVVDDTAIEANETMIMTLSNPRGAALSSNTTYTYTIQDNDQPTINFSAVTSTGTESTTTVTIPVNLSVSSPRETKVNYALTGTSTGGGIDYTLANGTLTIPAGQTTGNITVNVINDTATESNETIVLTLSSPVDGTLGSTTVHTYTITDNDTPTIQFLSSNSSGGEATTPVTVVLALSTAATVDVQVAYAITGTATGSGTDYTLANGTATITAGQTTTNLSLAVVDDATVDAGETVVITISSPTNATLGTTAVYTYTINDND